MSLVPFGNAVKSVSTISKKVNIQYLQNLFSALDQEVHNEDWEVIVCNSIGSLLRIFFLISGAVSKSRLCKVKSWNQEQFSYNLRFGLGAIKFRRLSSSQLENSFS
ncbi:MAG: hypothetical protein MHMPM18_000278 [Marteilia pararefringens]